MSEREGPSQRSQNERVDQDHMLSTENLSLRSIAELDAIQEGIDICIDEFSPASMALFMELFGRHLLMNAHHLQVAMAIDEAIDSTQLQPQQGSAGMDERAY